MECYTMSRVQGHGKWAGQKTLVGKFYDMNDLLIEFMCCPPISDSNAKDPSSSHLCISSSR
jgi:hypothetical protein